MTFRRRHVTTIKWKWMRLWNDIWYRKRRCETQHWIWRIKEWKVTSVAEMDSVWVFKIGLFSLQQHPITWGTQIFLKCSRGLVGSCWCFCWICLPITEYLCSAMRRWRWRLVSLSFAFDNGDMSSPKRHILIASFVIILLILLTY